MRKQEGSPSLPSHARLALLPSDAAMAKRPRLLIASISADHEPAQATLALMSLLRANGLHIQHFRSLAAFTPVDYVTPLTGLASRHLDPWIMSPDLCRELFFESAGQADIAIIEGCVPYSAEPAAPRWAELAQLLDCPVVAVVPADTSPNSLPVICHPIDAVFIDQFESQEQYLAQKNAIEAILQKPVVGGLGTGAVADSAVESMRRGKTVPGNMLDEMARRACAVTDVSRLLALARSRPFAPARRRRQRPASQSSPRVAIAYDDCFHCYFPETLDALEFLGAEVIEFSPLADERLPDGTDIVYLGCGHPENHTAALAENECMRAAIRQHVCTGKRLYAEGGGAVYLCQHLVRGGSSTPMVGVFAADAEFTGCPLPRPQPVELASQRPNWIAAAGQTVRGYRTSAWRLTPRQPLSTHFLSNADSPEVLVRHHAIASVVHINFAAQPQAIHAFFEKHAPSLSIRE